MTAISAFVTSLITSFIVFLILLLIYTFLVRRPGNRFIYYPALILKGKETPESAKSRAPWTWMVEAYKVSEAELVEIAGLDAVIYLQLFNAALKIILFSGVFLIPTLIPLALTDDNIKVNKAANNATTKLDYLAMTNIKPKSQRIWAFLIGMYVVSFVTYYVLYKTYKHVIELRSEAQMATKAPPEQFACLVRDIPKLSKDETRSEQVDHFFRTVHPDTYEKATIVTKLNKASKLWTQLETAKAKLAHAEAVFEQSKSKAHPDGVRPTHKTGKFGLYGPKVDSIDYWNEKLKELPPQLQETQSVTKTDMTEGAALVFFNSRRAAAEASQEKHSPFADRWEVLPAPEPRAVIWETMHISFYQRMVREKVVYVIVFFVIVFYMIPIIFIAGLSTIDNLTKYLPFLKPVVKIKPIQTIIQAYFPQLALIIFLALLPKLLSYLSKQEGIVSKAHLERAASGKYFYFMVFNVFIGYSLFGTLFSSANSINKLKTTVGISFSSIINLFGSQLPPNATYFITFVALKFFAGYGLELSRLVPLIIFHIKRKYLCKTDAEVEAAWAPGAFSYLSLIPNDLLVLVITYAYAVIAPLILPFAFLYYGIGWFVYRNQALKVYVPDYESGGRFWPHIHNRFLAGLVVAQITAIGYFAIKKFAFVFFLFPLLLITYLFFSITQKVFYPSFKYVSILVASEEVKEVPTLSSIVDAFTPTCLLASSTSPDNDKTDDSKYLDAESQLPSRSSSGIASPSDNPRAVEAQSLHNNNSS
ncbi:unnamed protein product [Calypogeia fissa]